MRVVMALVISVSLCAASHASFVVDFEELTFFSGTSPNHPAGTGQFYNGDKGTGSNSDGWASKGVFFNNDFDGTFGSWSGWAYSNVKNDFIGDFTNQYASVTGGGADGTSVYAMAYFSSFSPAPFINLPTNTVVTSVSLTNSTYAALSMRDGDMFAKKFGGVSGDDPDFFEVSLTGHEGLDGSGNTTGSVVVALADFRFSDNSQDYILDDWLSVDLTPLGNARSISLNFTSSDLFGSFINTPTYVALDNLALTAVPEPSSFVLIAAVGATAVLVRRRRKRVAKSEIVLG